MSIMVKNSPTPADHASMGWERIWDAERPQLPSLFGPGASRGLQARGNAWNHCFDRRGPISDQFGRAGFCQMRAQPTRGHGHA